MRSLTLAFALAGFAAGGAPAFAAGTVTGGGCMPVGNCSGCNYQNGASCFQDASCMTPCSTTTTSSSTTGGVPELPAGMAGPLTLAVAGAAIYLRRRYVKNKAG